MKIIIYVTLAIQAYQLQAQEDNLRQIFRKTFYDMRIHNKIFFEYEGKEGITFMEQYKKGMKGAFMLPDTNIQRHYPNILELVGTSHATEKYFMTMTLISHPSGNVFVSSNVLDPAILLWVNFDKILIDNKKAILNFHTTSLRERESLKENYISVECELKKRKRGWIVTSIRVEPRLCCSSLW